MSAQYADVTQLIFRFPVLKKNILFLLVQLYHPSTFTLVSLGWSNWCRLPFVVLQRG